MLAISLFIFMETNALAKNIDPTGPFGHKPSPVDSMKETKTLVLEAVIHGNGIHTVVINGKVLKMFDTIGEYKITAVNDQSVILRSDERRIKLTVFKNNLVKYSNIVKDSTVK